jgi:hypothetical protein
MYSTYILIEILPKTKYDGWSAVLILISHDEKYVKERFNKKTRTIDIGFINTFGNGRRDNFFDDIFRCIRM